MHGKLDTYRRHFRSDPASFFEGVASFCKQAGVYEPKNKSLFMRILPWLMILGGGWMALKGGETWGRYANRTGNPGGPIKGPISKLLESVLPENETLYWPGQPGYDATLKRRAAETNAAFEKKYGPINSGSSTPDRGQS